MKSKYSLRSGKSASEVRAEWQFNYPNTVVDRVQPIGRSSSGEKMYHVFYHDRQKESKRNKTVRRIRASGGKFGKTFVGGQRK